MTIIVIITI